jgi:hypothetical protein
VVAKKYTKKKQATSPPEAFVPKKQMIKARPVVVSELYHMEPNLLNAGWEKGETIERENDYTIIFTKDDFFFTITCEPLHITWRKFSKNEDGAMNRQSLILGVIHYDIKKEEYLNYI